MVLAVWFTELNNLPYFLFFGNPDKVFFILNIVSLIFTSIEPEKKNCLVPDTIAAVTFCSLDNYNNNIFLNPNLYSS